MEPSPHSPDIARGALATECLGRIAGLEQAMAGQGLATLVVLGRGIITQYGHLQYLSNYCPMIRVGALVLRPGRPPVLALPTEADVALARPIAPVGDLRIATIGDDGSGTSSLARLIRELANGERTIGVVGLEDILVAAEFGRWRTAMPGVEFRSEATLLARAKMKKSALEIAEIEASATIADDAFEALVAALRHGRTLRAAAGAAESELRAQGAGEVLVYVSRGPHYRHRPPPGPAEAGDLLTVFVELSNANGYWGEFARLIAVGTPDPQRRRLAAHCIGALDRIEALLTTGIAASALYREVAEGAAAAGYACDATIGHGFGMDHDWPAVGPRDDTVIDAGTTVSMHPQFVSLDGAVGASLGDAFVVTQGGARPLSRIPRDLMVL